MEKPERVRSAPGLVWKKRGDNIWDARWQCRSDIIARGYPIKGVKLGRWVGESPTFEDWDFLAEHCRSLQKDMLAWANGDDKPRQIKFDKRTLGSLMDCYQTDKASDYRKLRHASRMHYDVIIRLIRKDHGHEVLHDLNARTFKIWHEEWGEGGKVSAAHSKMGMLRILFGFGMTMLEDRECERLSVVLSKMKFKSAPPREETLTIDQVIAIRAKAHELGRPSIALAQAIQFECMFRQKDVIGEWVPLSEPVVSDVIVGSEKWIRGVRWEEINQRMILTHITSKRSKKIAINLSNSPMVMEEFEHVRAQYDGKLPANGPIIRSEFDGQPWSAQEFRRWWRKLAYMVGIPKEVRNMDTRATAASEADDGGAEMEWIREAATHSNVAMTRRYTRHREKKIEKVQMTRLAFRNKTERSDD